MVKLTEEERRKLAGGKSVLPDDSSPKSDAERSIAQEEAAAGAIGARDVNRMDQSKQLITGSAKRKFSYDPYNAVAKSRVQLALLELIGTFCCGGGQTPTRNGRPLPRGLFMQQKQLADQLFTDQSTISKVLGSLANRGLIFKVDGVWVMNWTELELQARERGWVPEEGK